MAHVVVLDWDPILRQLTYVEVNGGDGGGVQTLAVPGGSAAEISRQWEAMRRPCVGFLEPDDDLCLLELNGPVVRRCAATLTGPKRQRVVLLTDRETGAQAAQIPPAQIGLADPDAAAQAHQIGSFLLFEQDVMGQVIGCWECDGGLKGWFARRLERREQKAAMQRAGEARRQAEADRKAEKDRRNRRFVNPYTFLPFPAAIDRGRPSGHRALGPGRLSGSLQVRWEFTTPFQAPDGSVTDTPLRLTGASVKGAVRATHESLAGGCLRVLDEEFVPSYRDQVQPLQPGWALAVVADTASDGTVRTVQLCDQVVWVPVPRLHRVWEPERLTTGCRMSLSHHGWHERLGRLELDDEVEIVPGDDWVVLLTDAGARRPTERTDERGRGMKHYTYFAACGRLGTAEPVTVTPQAWREFRLAVAGAREVQQRRAAGRDGQPAPTQERIEYPKGNLIGFRKAATGWFDKGDVLWARQGQHPTAEEPNAVHDLRLAAVWRHRGAGPLGERVPAHLRPCTDPASLCPSCRIFGAADTRPRDPDGRARQRAYAGQVRFGDAVSPTPVPLRVVDRAPLGSPRPGAGQFYLRVDDPKPAAQETDLPTREWGAAPDRSAPRQVRGRKYYWHADPRPPTPPEQDRPGQDPIPAMPPRHLARQHQITSKLAESRLLADPGTVLVQTVTFDNLSPAELGGLLAALEPQRVLPGDRPVLLHLGGGKPLGLGSCRAQVQELTVWTAASRYGDGPHVVADHDGYLAAFRAAVLPEVQQTWPALAAVLGADTVDPALVWYPPGANRDAPGKDGKDFDEPFAFFKETSGQWLKTKARPMRPLPEPTDPDQSLEIIPRRSGRAQRGIR